MRFPFEQQLACSSAPARLSATSNGGAWQASRRAHRSQAGRQAYAWPAGHQPVTRDWAFQGIETGVFVLLAGALLAVTAIVVLRRDAKYPVARRYPVARPVTAQPVAPGLAASGVWPGYGERPRARPITT